MATGVTTLRQNHATIYPRDCLPKQLLIYFDTALDLQTAVADAQSAWFKFCRTTPIHAQHTSYRNNITRCYLRIASTILNITRLLHRTQRWVVHICIYPFIRLWISDTAKDTGDNYTEHEFTTTDLTTWHYSNGTEASRTMLICRLKQLVTYSGSAQPLPIIMWHFVASWNTCGACRRVLVTQALRLSQRQLRHSQCSGSLQEWKKPGEVSHSSNNRTPWMSHYHTDSRCSAAQRSMSRPTWMKLSRTTQTQAQLEADTANVMRHYYYTVINVFEQCTMLVTSSWSVFPQGRSIQTAKVTVSSLVRTILLHWLHCQSSICLCAGLSTSITSQIFIKITNSVLTEKTI